MSIIDVLSASMLEVNRGPRPGYVYVLIVGDEVGYVGQTGAGVESRLDDHEAAGLSFDRVLYVKVERCDLDRVEGALIRALLPRDNTSAPVYRGGDNDVLAKLGLPTHADEAAAAASSSAVLRSRRRKYTTARNRAA